MKPHPFFKTLKGKAALFILALSLLGMATLVAVLMKTARSMQTEFQNEKVRLVEDFVMRTLTPVMLAGHGEMMSELMSSYKDIQNVKKIEIVRVNGAEAFTDGETMDKVNGMLGEKRFTRRLRPARQAVPPDDPRFATVIATGGKEVYTRDADDGKTVEMMFPIINEESCHGCHGADNHIRGVLLSTFAMTKEDRRLINDMLLLSVIAFIVILITSFGALVFFNTMVANRITGIIRRVNEIVTHSHFNTRIAIGSGDELDDLSAAFNHFIASVERYRRAEEREKERLETTVRERTKELQEKNDFIEADLMVARRIQQKLLPEKFPENPNTAFHAAYLPCLHLGGDYYDVFEMPNGHVGVFIADASGHGSSAALIVAIVKSLLSTIGKEIGSPGYVVQQVSKTLSRLTPDDSFCTLFYAVINTRTGGMTYSLAGHPPPVVVNRHTGAARLLESNGGLVGIFDFDRFGDSVFMFQPGDRLFAYTDGIVEAANKNAELFGSARLIRVLEENRGLDAVRITEAALAAMKNHTGDEPLGDDVALLVMDYQYEGKIA
ncbi:MAG: SpoIIE family protein phosphatase [Nitrospinae bacterium]|nr:SpoIIE family protein phosphatase [Nitrospinota bacterium]